MYISYFAFLDWSVMHFGALQEVGRPPEASEPAAEAGVVALRSSSQCTSSSHNFYDYKVAITDVLFHSCLYK